MEQTSLLPNESVQPEPLVNPPAKSFSPKKLFSIVLSIILFLVLFYLIINLYVKSQTPSQAPNTSPAPVVEPTFTPDLTTDWKTYEAENVSIKYPPSYQVVLDTNFFKEGDLFFIVAPAPPHKAPGLVGATTIDTLGIAKPLNTDLTLDNWFTDYENSTSKPASSKVSYNSKLAGLDTIQLSTCGNGCFEYFFTKYNGKIYSLAYRLRDSFDKNIFTDEEILEIQNNIDQILSTFKFLDENQAGEAINRITYQNSNLGFEIKFPKSWLGKYSVVEEPKIIQVSYKESTTSKAVLFSISVMTDEEWQKTQSEPHGILIKRDEAKQLVYVEYLASENPFSDPVKAQEFQKMSGDIKTIISTFKLLETNQ